MFPARGDEFSCGRCALVENNDLSLLQFTYKLPTGSMMSTYAALQMTTA